MRSYYFKMAKRTWLIPKCMNWRFAYRKGPAKRGKHKKSLRDHRT